MPRRKPSYSGWVHAMDHSARACPASWLPPQSGCAVAGDGGKDQSPQQFLFSTPQPHGQGGRVRRKLLQVRLARQSREILFGGQQHQIIGLRLGDEIETFGGAEAMMVR